MTDNTAISQGYTEEYYGYTGMGEVVFILVKPETDFDDTFKAWDMDNQEFVKLNGWLWIFEKNDEGE